MTEVANRATFSLNLTIFNYLNFNSMKKLKEIQDIQALNVEQAQTVKGGARDTRGSQTTSTSTYTGGIKIK